MIDRRVPAWFPKAKEIAARVRSPAGKPFAAAKKGKCATLHLYDAIGKDPWSGTGIGPEDVVKALAEADGADELAVHVNSPGGYVFDGIAIYNAIRGFKGKKTVYVDGLAASIASIIALAGDRVVTCEGAMWMIHDPAGGIFSFGTADQIEDDARKTVAALRKVRENLIDIYTSSTGQGAGQVSGWMTAETWMTAAEAKDRGFTDEVVTSDAACACSCDECQSGDCPDCSCGGCASCAAGESCNGGDCDQGDGHKMKARALSPRVSADLARAQVRALHDKFTGASPGSTGEPVTRRNATPGRKTP